MLPTVEEALEAAAREIERGHQQDGQMCLFEPADLIDAGALNRVDEVCLVAFHQGRHVGLRVDQRQIMPQQVKLCPSRGCCAGGGAVGN